MNEVTGSVLDARAAGAYARADGLVPAGPVRAPDAVTTGFAVEGRGNPPRAQGPAASRDGGETGAVAALPSSQRGAGLLGALTSFLARAFGQPAEAEASPAATRLAGLRAYSRMADLPGRDIGATGVELLAPSLPRLSSGRALDLSV